MICGSATFFSRINRILRKKKKMTRYRRDKKKEERGAMVES